MTDPALANAERRRDELAAEINKVAQQLDGLRKRLAGVESFIAAWHNFAANAPDSWPWELKDSQKDTGFPQGRMPLTSPPASDSPPPQQLPATPKNSDKAEVGREAKGIIYEMGKPVPRTDLYKELIRRGLVIKGKDPEMVLSTMMWRMKDDFVRLPGHGYWIKTLPWKPARYEPGTPPQQDIEDLEIEINALENGDDDAEGFRFRGYFLLPQQEAAGGWHVMFNKDGQSVRRTSSFPSRDLAVDEAKTIIQSIEPLRRI